MPDSSSLAQRFEQHVDRSGGHGPWGTCHVWTGAATKEGYGRFRIDGKIHRAHRVALFLATGAWPTAPCVNSQHLKPGTKAQNNADMATRGRARGGGPPGERHGRAKLTEVQVLAIRRDERGQSAIALQYGVHQATVSAIKRRKLWAHV